MPATPGSYSLDAPPSPHTPPSHCRPGGLCGLFRLCRPSLPSWLYSRQFSKNHHYINYVNMKYKDGKEIEGSSRLRRSEWEVRSIPLRDAQELVRAHHYAKGGANTGVFVHGLICKATGAVHGVAWWLPPTRVACESVNRENWRGVLSLTRMVITPGTPKNACSFLLARSVKEIKKDGRFVTLVTWADEGEGHDGGVYRAANWDYLGANSGDERWIDPQTGRHVARKSAGKSRTISEMESLGYVRGGKSRKHKFVLHIRPSAKKECAQSDLFGMAA